MSYSYLRWKIGEPRLSPKGRFKLAADHQEVQEPGVCVVCGYDFKTGDEVVVMVVGPDTPENVERHNAEQWYSALAVAIHEQCSNRRSAEVA